MPDNTDPAAELAEALAKAQEFTVKGYEIWRGSTAFARLPYDDFDYKKNAELIATALNERTAMQARIEALEGALGFYQDNVSLCNRRDDEGDMARDRLAKDYGQRALKALGGDHER